MNSTSMQPQAVAVVCQVAKDSVTHLCAECGLAPARNRFCSGKCRQAAYRKSPAHAAHLEKLKAARKRRRKAWQTEISRARSFGIGANNLRYGGPRPDGVPQLGQLKLKNYF